MSATRRIVFGVSIVWLIRAIAIASGLLLLPVLWRVLSQEELGTWNVIGISQGFMSMLNFGVPPTLMRHIALAKGRSGADPDVKLTVESERHIADLVATGRTILRWVAVFTFVVALPAGLLFVDAIDFQKLSPLRVGTAWIILCAGYSVGVWVSYLECWIAGVGYIGRSNLIVAAIAVLTLCANIVAALAGGGILALSCIFVAAGLIQRWAFRITLRRTAPELIQAPGHWNGEFARSLVRPSLHTWLYFLGYFLAMQGGAFFIIRMLGPADVPKYNAAYTLFVNLQLLAGSFAVTSTVFLSQAWQAGDSGAVRRHTIRFAQLGLAIMAVGVGFMLTAGQEMIELWLGPDSFVGYQVLTVMGIAYTIQIHSVILTTCARATEDEQYAASSVAAGIATVVLCWFLVGRWGVLGAALSMLIAELVSNAWYCIIRPLHRLQIDLGSYAARVGLLGAAAFLLTVLMCDVLVDRLHAVGANRMWIVIVAATVSALVFGGVVWLGVFDGSHRRRILDRARRWFA